MVLTRRKTSAWEKEMGKLDAFKQGLFAKREKENQIQRYKLHTALFHEVSASWGEKYI